ncbi:hypothetical protein NBRC10512_004172 [Rhodotorula toruloides]|uniref:RHTO0S01e00122g1_1 n=2 Tax=Rhodotorula toruloides TaxID=5286 RepID=A0A061AL99_RHOTO|nr:uncharacterized protein RHTO_06697 [Rhodotorula toruloides NP11]EMS18117.1 hypothetical protein RHTO_06697 [Rhodotorula toruloides NP11]CDR35477.1 RHTO0S01e00122g1_1 [Rhodotorula toruloides]
MPAVPPSPTRSSHSSRSSVSHAGDTSDHDDGEVHSLSSQSDHEHPSLTSTHGYSSSDDWSASDAEHEQDDFDLVASRDLREERRGSISAESSEADEAGEGKMRLSYPDPMARESDHDEDSHSSRSEELLGSHDGQQGDLATSLVGGDYSLLLDVSPASPVSSPSTSASSFVPPTPPLSPAPSQHSSSTSAALHAWLRSTSSRSSSSASSTIDAQAHPHPVLRKMSSEEKTDQAVQASLGEEEKSVVLESMGSSAATVVPASSVVTKSGASIGEEKRVVEERKEEASATMPAKEAASMLDAPLKPTKTTELATSRTCSSARPSRADAPPDFTWTLGAILALCVGLWVAGSRLSSGKELAASTAAVSSSSLASQVKVVSHIDVPAPATSTIDLTTEAVASPATPSIARTTEPVAASSSSPASSPLSTKSWTSFLGLGSAPVRSALPAAPEVVRDEAGVTSEAGFGASEVKDLEASESSPTGSDGSSVYERDEADQDAKADSTSPFLVDAPEEAFKDFFSTSHMKELHEWFVAAGQRSSRRFQQDAQEVLAHLAKLRVSAEIERPPSNPPSMQHDFPSILTSLRLPGFDYALDIDRVRSRFADFSAHSASHADQVLRRAARSLDRLSSTTALSLSHLSHSLSPVLDSTVDRLKAGTRFSESKIKRAAWTAQILERRVKWMVQGGAEEEYPKLCGCPFA